MSRVRADVEIGHRVGVVGTPTYFVNGVKMPTTDAKQIELVVRHELRAAGIEK
jgi:protein-disulfide isomerase